MKITTLFSTLLMATGLLVTISTSAMATSVLPDKSILPRLTLDPSARNITTTEFFRLYPRFRDTDKAVPWAQLKKYKVLYVPGILSNAVILMGVSGGLNYRLGEYFDEQMADLRAHGVATERVEVESEGSPEGNASVIANAINRSDRPVILITHSKGGLDTLEMLLRKPALIKKIRGWVPVQSPFQGSPVADYCNNRDYVRQLTAGLIDLLNGSIRVLDSLTMAERVPYMNHNRNTILKIVSQIPVISLTSEKEHETMGIDSILALFRDILWQLGYPSDGVVPWQSAVLPGADYIHLYGVDHMATVMYSRFGEFDRVGLNRTLLSMLLSRH